MLLLTDCRTGITDEVHKFATHDAKGKQRKVAEMIQLQPEGEPDDHLLSGQFEPWREPTPTGGEVLPYPWPPHTHQ